MNMTVISIELQFDWNNWNNLTACKLFVLRIVTWTDICLPLIIISYLISYNCVNHQIKNKLNKTLRQKKHFLLLEAIGSLKLFDCAKYLS